MEGHLSIVPSYINNLASSISTESANLVLIIFYLHIVKPAMVKMYSLDSKELVAVSILKFRGGGILKSKDRGCSSENLK